MPPASQILNSAHQFLSNSKLHFKYIVQFYGCTINEDKLYLVTELCSTNLRKYMKANRNMLLKEKVQLLSMITIAMNHLHSFDPPILHRDLKPENVLLTENGKIKLGTRWTRLRKIFVYLFNYCSFIFKINIHIRSFLFKIKLI